MFAVWYGWVIAIHKLNITPYNSDSAQKLLWFCSDRWALIMDLSAMNRIAFGVVALVAIPEPLTKRR